MVNDLNKSDFRVDRGRAAADHQELHEQLTGRFVWGCWWTRAAACRGALEERGARQQEEFVDLRLLSPVSRPV